MLDLASLLVSKFQVLNVVLFPSAEIFLVKLAFLIHLLIVLLLPQKKFRQGCLTDLFH